MTISFASIVEGHGEVDCVRVLLERLLYEEFEQSGIRIATPYRVKRHRVVKPGKLEESVEEVLTLRKNVQGLLILLDADDDCPADLGSSLQQRVEQIKDIPMKVVLANKNFESWFLAAKASLSGTCGISASAENYSDAEKYSSTKSRLTENMDGTRKYMETDDQASLARVMDLSIARTNSPSFDKFFRATQAIVDEMEETV